MQRCVLWSVQGRRDHKPEALKWDHFNPGSAEADWKKEEGRVCQGLITLGLGSLHFSLVATGSYWKVLSGQG